MVVEHDFELKVIYPGKTEKMHVKWIEVETELGSFTVGPRHSPIVAMLRPEGQVTYSLRDGAEVKLDITAGIFTVAQGKAFILMER